jgi:hypothetical protein
MGDGRSSGTALVTGASYGIGRELAVCCARGGFDLVLVARSGEKLRSLAAEIAGLYPVKARALEADLGDPGAPGRIERELSSEGAEITALVNNAGFGANGPFASLALEVQREMLQVNVVALTHLTRLVLPGMVARRRGRILNVASTAAFQPGPLMAVYYASKAYVLSFSEALSEELRGSGVTVTALCPGPTASGFQARAQMEHVRLVSRPAMDARRVAETGYAGMMAGKAVVVPGLPNRLLAQSVRISPRFLVRRIAGWLNATAGGSPGSGG